MRYVVTTLLVLGLGITAMAPVAFAQVNMAPNNSFTNQYGNQVYPTTPGSGGGAVCYMDGVAYSCTQPAKVAIPNPDSGSLAGPVVPAPQMPPFYGGDRN